MDTPFTYNPEITAVVQKYGNGLSGFVADQVLPPIKVATREFRWTNFNKEQGYKVEDDTVGRTSQVHEIDALESDMVNDKTQDKGLEIALPYSELKVPGGYTGISWDVKAANAQYLTGKVLLNKEVRFVKQVLDPALWPDWSTGSYYGKQVDWADAGIPTRGDTILDDLLGYKESGQGRLFNSMLISSKVASALRRAAAFRGELSSTKMVPLAQVGELLGIPNIIVADGYYDLAAEGLTQNLTEIVGSSILLFHKNMNFQTSDAPEATFGFNAYFDPMGNGPMVSMEYEDRSIGLWGGLRLRVGMSHKFVVADRSLGMLITNVLDGAP